MIEALFAVAIGAGPAEAQDATDPRSCLPITSAERGDCYVRATGGRAAGEEDLKNLVLAYSMSGHPDTARALGREFLASYPRSAHARSVGVVTGLWPRANVADCLPISSESRARCYLGAADEQATGEAGLRNLVLAYHFTGDRRIADVARRYLDRYPDSRFAAQVRQLAGVPAPPAASCLPITTAARARCYLERIESQPTEERGLRNLMLAHALAGDRRRARELARAYVEAFPQSAFAGWARVLVGPDP